MAYRIEQTEQLPCAIGIAQVGEGQRCPHRCMGVLAAVFAHARHVALDVPGRWSRGIEGRVEQLDDARVGMDEAAMQRRHGAACTLGRCRTGQHRPALGDGIDLTFRIRRRAERRAVVKPCALVPVAIPGRCFDTLAQLHAFAFAEIGEGGIRVASRHRCESLQHRDEKEGQPDAFALACDADQIHAVVPVAHAHQRQPMLAVAQAVPYRPLAVVVKAGCLVRDLGQFVVG